MKFDLISLVGLVAVGVMLLNLFLTVTLGAQVKGGMIGQRWRVMTTLVVLFSAGYFVLPFLGSMPAETLRLVVSLIFFFGAVYVLITLRLIHGIIRELTS